MVHSYLYWIHLPEHREHNLDRGAMLRVAKGQQIHHKGWVCECLEVV